MPPPVDVTDDPAEFEEAIKAFRRRVPMPDWKWDALSEAEREFAFKVSGVAQADLATEAWEAVDRAIKDGTTLDDFKRQVGPQLEAAWGRENPARLETIFRTNALGAYNAGRHEILNHPEVKKARPYWRFDGIDDDRQCFAAGTRVALPDKRDARIETIRPGDLVLSCRGVPRRVTAALVSPQRAWLRLHLSTGKPLLVTPNHPILTVRGWVRAGRLRAGDRLIHRPVNDQELQRLWLRVRTDPQPPEVLPGGVHPELHPAAAVQVLRKGLPGHPGLVEDWLLLARLQGRQQAPGAAAMPPLRRGVPASRRGQDVVFSSMPHGHQDVRVVSALLQREEALRRAGSVSVLHQSVQGRSEARRRSTQEAESQMSSLRSCVSFSPQRFDRTAASCSLFTSLPEEQGCFPLYPVWEEDRGQDVQRRPPLLLGGMLSPLQGRDSTGGCCADRTDRGDNSVRAGGEGRPVGGRLPRRGPDRPGGGRGLLASEAWRAGERLAAGCEARSPWLHGGPPVRGGCDGSAGDGAHGIAALWPYPGPGLLAHPFVAVVVGIDRFLIAAAEPAYDIEVDEDAGYIAEGIVVHNSEICAALDGTIRPADDPFWHTHTPPLHFNCRSILVPLSEEEAQDEGVDDEAPEVGADEGFGKPPTVGGDWEPDTSDYPGPIADVLGAKLEVAPGPEPDYGRAFPKTDPEVAPSELPGAEPVKWARPHPKDGAADFIARNDDQLKGAADLTQRLTGTGTGVSSHVAKPALLQGAVGLYYNATGQIELQEGYVANPMRTAVGRGEVATIAEENAFQTLLHEQFHAASNPARFGFARGRGQMEESTTELLAQHYKRSYIERLGLRNTVPAEGPMFAHSEHGPVLLRSIAYSDFIQGLARLVSYVDGVTAESPAAFERHVAGRALQIKRAPNAAGENARYGMFVRPVLVKHGVKPTDPKFAMISEGLTNLFADFIKAGTTRISELDATVKRIVAGADYK